MGSVFWVQGITFRVNQDERNEAPHIHCYRGDCEARFNIRDLVWMDGKGFTRSDIRKLEERILARLEECRAEWEQMYGQYKW